ncbi:hypothetical protein BB559_006959 [Furculomyces boomerangus]|uniref:Uncharacterized protein n=1 Tax=Furculomyces boomerangus TaxID=61424 RepID=A0A2T9XZR1_9FUNG|nr:hypothetical protein BB559_006959 [Furculomyces boomerangus]
MFDMSTKSARPLSNKLQSINRSSTYTDENSGKPYRLGDRSCKLDDLLNAAEFVPSSVKSERVPSFTSTSSKSSQAQSDKTMVSLPPISSLTKHLDNFLETERPKRLQRASTIAGHENR